MVSWCKSASDWGARMDRGGRDRVIQVRRLPCLHRDRDWNLKRQFSAVCIGLNLVSL